MSLLVAFLPDQAFVLVFAGVGLALIVGLLSRRAAFNILGGVVLLLLLAPFIEMLIDGLPGWVVLALLVGVMLSSLRALSSLLLGRRAADHMVGQLAAGLVLGIFRLAFAPVRWVLRRI